MTNKIVIEQKTIIIPIGITNCGKSYFFENHLIPFLKGIESNPSIHYLSSDKMRAFILNDNDLHKHASKGLQVSKQAFSILENQLDNLTQYPVNTDVVIVDAMNLIAEHREFIFKIAQKNNYKVVGLLFDYKKRDEYFKYIDKDPFVNVRVITDRLSFFRENTIKEIKKSEFSKLYTIPSTDFSSFEFVYEETNHIKPNTDNFERFCVVGDVHGCLDELIEAVTDNKGLSYNKETGLLEITNQEKYHHHILVGDYIDKGPKTKETIKFLYDNQQFFWIVRGNHENFVCKFLKGELGSFDKNKELIENWFDTAHLLQDDEEHKQMLFTLFENSFDFIEGKNFIVTHAPCEVKFLSKSDNKSIKAQRTFVYPKKAEFNSEEEYIEAKEKSVTFLLDEAEYIHPLHFFGHIDVKEPFKYKNKFNLDTGCVKGNKLSTAIFTDGQKNPFIKSYDSKQPKKDDLNLLFTLKRKDISFVALDHEVKKRLEWAAENKLNFISGTMSPTDKDESTNDLESLKKGIEYYKNNGIDKIILQPKFMGSRGNLLLHKDNITKCKLFSRQGYEIKNERLKAEKNILGELFGNLQGEYSDLFDELKAEYILFDGELLPWTVMGKGLIDKDFIIPAKAIESELELLKENSFFDVIEDFKERFKDKTEADSSLKPHEKTHLKNWNKFKKEFQTTEIIEKNIKQYMEQLNYFIADAPLSFRPFSILKVIKLDGSEENYISETKSNIDIYDAISDGCYAVLDFKNLSCILSGVYGSHTQTTNKVNSFDELLTIAQKFWNYITEQQHMEGVVIKPEKVYQIGIAPYLKCRNKEYLKLVYGMDYESLSHKKANLIKTKNIKRKIATSIKEWALGKKMLDIKMKDISIKNPEWVSLAYQLITEQEQEKTLDPRL